MELQSALEERIVEVVREAKAVALTMLRWYGVAS